MAGSAYQLNLSQPREEENKGFTTRDVYRIIAETSEYDMEGAQSLYNKFRSSQQDASSKYYNPYSQATNRAVRNLQSYGFDINNLNDNWFNQNMGWISSNLVYNGTTNTPSAPTKKFTMDQRVAYELYQYHKSEGTTKKAEQEWAALQEELTFWAQLSDRNYSDEEILKKIDWSKYKTLAAMDENKYMAPTELNRGIDYSEDAMYGVLWAARNPEFQGDLFGAIANSAMGTGYQWQENPEIAARLNVSDRNTYAPYTVGSTIDEVCLYYNQPSFTREWLLANRPDGSDETATKMWNRAWKAEEFTEDVEAEVDKATAWLNKVLATAKDPDTVMKYFDNKLKNDWKNLKKLDDSLELVDSLLDTTRRIKYDYKDVRRLVEEQCAKNREASTDDQVVGHAAGINVMDANGTPVLQGPTDAQQEANKAANAKLEDVAGMVEDDEEVTPMLQDVMANGWSVGGNEVYDAWTGLKNFGESIVDYLIGGNKKSVMDTHANNTLANFQGMYDYETLQNDVNNWKAEAQALRNKVGVKEYAGKVVEDNKEVTVSVDGQNYRIGLRLDGNNSYYMDWADWLSNGNEGGVDSDTFDMLAQSDAVNDIIRKNNVDALAIQSAKAQNLGITEEDQMDLDRLRELELSIEDGEAKLAEDQDNYQIQLDAFEKAQIEREQSLFWMRVLGMDTSDFDKEDAVIGYLVDIADYDATVWNAYSPSATYRFAIENGEDINEVLAAAEDGNKKITEELEDARTVLEYIESTGLQVPANYLNNLKRHIGKLERDQQDYEYFKLSQKDDFAEVAQKGREAEYNGLLDVMNRLRQNMTIDEYYKMQDETPYINPAAGNEGFSGVGLKGIMAELYSQMTDYEKDTYYYLLGSGQEDEATQYALSLRDESYGVLHSRFTEELQNQVADSINQKKSADFATQEELDKWIAGHQNENYDVKQDDSGYHVTWEEVNVGSFLGLNALAILASPFASMASLGYAGATLLTGGELNPENARLFLNNFKSTTRAESAKAISDFCGEGTTGQKVVQMFYDILSNRLDSVANGAAFGWLGAGIANNMLSEWVSAAPMGVTAAMDAMMEVKRRGGSDGQAWCIGFATFLAESGTEAISLENIKEAFQLGKDITAGGLKEFLIKWLTKNGISEMLGESANDIIENLADDLFMGELSDHKDLVWSYRMKGYKKEDAEAMALKDEIKSIMYTALTSYLSPGTDIIHYAVGRGKYYLSKTDKEKGISLRDVFKEEKQKRQEARETSEDIHEPGAINLNELDAELEYRQFRDTVEDLQQNGVENGEGALNLPQMPRNYDQVAQNQTNETAEEPEKKIKYKASKPTHDAAQDYNILESVKSATISAQTATVASVINTSRTRRSGMMAMAASMRIQSILDSYSSHQLTALEFVQNMLLGSQVGETDVALVKQAIQNAALAEGSEANVLLRSDEFWSADYDEQASMLAATVANDRKNQNVNDAMARGLHDYRVAEAVKDMARDGFLDAEEKAKNSVNDAKTKVDARQKAVNKAQQEMKAKTDTLKTITNEHNENPTADSGHMMDRALNDCKTANDNLQRAKNELKDSQKELKDAQKALKDTKQSTWENMYRQAEERIAQEDQQEIEREAEQKRLLEEQAQREEEQKRIKEEERKAEEELRAKIEAEARETENFARLNAEEFVDQTLPNLSDDDRRYAIGRVMRLQKEMSGDFYSVQGRKIFANAFAKKFGLNVQYTNDTWYNARVDPKTGTMMVSKQATQGDIMYAVMVHELTHMAEQSETYNELADTVLQMKYGEGMTWNAILGKMNSGDTTSRLAQDILARKQLYDKRLNKTHSYEDILQEFVADGVGYIVSGDQSAIDRLVAEKPSLARRILESIKSFLKKIAGIQGEPLTQAQNVVDMLQKALNESQKKGDVKHSLNAINDDYMNVAENGDMEAAQRYVDEYAKKKGYTLTVFHGTGEFFNIFKRGWEGIHLGNPDQAAQAADTRYRDRSETTDYRWGKIKDSISQMNTEQRESLVKSAYLLLDYMSNTDGLYDFSGDISNDSEVQSYVESIVDRYAQEQSEMDGFTTNPEDISLRMNTFDRPVGRRVMKLYAKINNPFLINGDVNSWTPMNIADVVLKRADGIATKEVYGENVDITGTDVTLTPEQRNTLEEIAEETGVTDETWDALSDVLGELGFDGIQYMNTYEGDRNSYSYMALKQSDIKLADAITRDENGEIIPLNERFNQENDDIRYSMSENVLAEDIDELLNDMPVEEFAEYAGINFDNEDEARTVMTNAVQDLKNEFDDTIYNGKLYVKPETLNFWLSGSGFASSNPNYAQAYITTMNPADFLRMTTVSEEGQRRILGEAERLDTERLSENAERQPIQLLIDEETGKIGGHEGRHRAVALARAGVTEMPVLLFDNATKYSKTPKDSMTLKGQDYGDNINGNEITFTDVVPLAGAYRDEITSRFTASAQEKAEAEANNQRILRYSLPDGTIETAVYIKDGELDNGEAYDFVGEILDGKKKYETRSHNRLARGWVGISRGGEGPVVEGRVKLGNPIPFQKYEEDGVTLTQIYKDSMIEGTNYDMEPGETKYAYPILEVEDFRDNPRPITTPGQYGKYKYSIPSDALYLSAVNHGDMETAQRMVDEKAKEAFPNSVLIQDGEFKKMWHHTNNEFTEFLPSMSEGPGRIKGIFFTPNEYGSVSSKNTNIHKQYYLNVENLKFAFGVSEDAQYAQELHRRQEGVTDRNEIARINKEFSDETGIDAFFDWQNGWYTILNPENIKSADAVTYDDNGNVIPLSERFNTEQQDIRYSLPSDEMLDELYRYYMENQQAEPFFQEQPDRGMQQRQFGYQTIQTVEGVRQEVKDWLKSHSRYRPQTNEQQVDRAVDWVIGLRSEIDPDGFWGALNEFESGNFNPLTADGQARMYVVMSLAANKNDVNVQKRIADAINKQGTSIGRALQARKLYRLMSPAGRVAVLQKEVDNMNAQLKSQGKEGNITLDYWTEQLAASAQTEEEFQKVHEQMWKELGAQLPVTMFDRLQAWRMVSMLGNPRTHIRNIVGNWAFKLPVFVKNKVGAGLESIFIKDGERTKALRIDRSLMDWINEDAQKMKSTLTGEGKYNDRAKAEKYKQPFGKSKLGKAAQKWADYSSSKLEQEDWWFLERHYKNALGNWMTANKVTGEQLENDEGMLDSARAYAIQEAQKATYRDANKFAEWLSKGDRIKGVRFLTTTVMPFKKTPLNIMKRGLEYSPLGFLKTIMVDSFRLAEYQKWATGKKTTKADWALSPAQYIDKFSAGLTGVGIAGLGALLTSLGCLKLGFKKKDPEDQFEQAEGKQEYSLNLELFGHDLSYTIDWLAPSSMPLFVGAAMMEAYQDNELDVGTLLEDLGTITEPIWNLSMVDGITSIFDTSDYDDTNKAMQIIMKVGMNYVNSFVPTALGQFSRAIDPTRRKSYVKSGDKPSTVLYEFEKLQNKTPFSVWNIPYRDHRGNIDRGNVVGRAIQNMVSPGYFNDKLPDASLKELHRLYTDNKTNENVKESELKNLAPSDAPHYFSVKGQTIRLTAEQYDQLDYETKQIEFDLIDRLLADPYYADLDDAERISMINDIRTFASQQAKFNQFPEFSREDWVSRAVKNGIDPLDVIKNRSEKHVESSQIEGWTNYLLNHIEDGDIEEQQRAIDSLQLLDPETDIDKIVKDGYVKQYQKAYKDGDDETMTAIRIMLEDAGFVFDYDDWLKNTIKNEDAWMEDYQ